MFYCNAYHTGQAKVERCMLFLDDNLFFPTIVEYVDSQMDNFLKYLGNFHKVNCQRIHDV